MRRARHLAVLLAPLALATAALSACGSDDGTDTTTVATDAPAPSEAPAATEAPAAEEESAGVGITPVPAEVADGKATITVTVGTDDFTTTGDRVVSVPLGTVVTVDITADVAQEYHLHGYDVEVEGEAGTPASITFTADQAGLFDLESHATEDVLLVISVEG